MNNLIARYRKELLDVAGFATSTVDTYASSVASFCEFVETSCLIDPLYAKENTCRPG